MPQRKHRAQRGTSSLPATGMLLSRRHLVLGGVALIVVFTGMAYWPALRGGFILDDDALLTKNPLIKAPDGLVRFWCSTEPQDYWPMTNTGFWLEWRLWGLHPTGYHVTNLLLHITAALLIWRILRTLSIPGAFLAALLFAIHPINVESVAWISQRKGLLAMVFFLLSILWYLQADRQPSPLDRPRLARWYPLSLLAFVLAMLSKGSVAILPLVLLMLVVWQRKRITVRDLVRTAPFFLVAVVLTGVNIWFQTHGKVIVVRDDSFAQRLVGAGAVVWFYLAKALLPIHLVFVYPQWHIQTSDLLWWLPVAAVAVVAVLWRQSGSKWGRPVLFAAAFFGVALIPVLGFTDVNFMRYSLLADDYQHLAIIGVVALMAAGWSVWHDCRPAASRSAATVSAIVVVGLLILLTWHQSRLYGDARTLYQATLDENPDCWMAHNNLGTVLLDTGRTQEAIDHFQQVLRLKPDDADAYVNLGVALLGTGRITEAIERYQQALRLKPDYAEAHNNLGNVLIQSGRFPEAIQHYQHALRLKPGDAETHNNLGNVLIQSGRFPEAIQHYQQALRLNPEYAEATNNLGIALLETNQHQEALVHFQQALRLEPDFTVAYANLAKAYAQMHRTAEAIAAAQKALDLARSQGPTALTQQIETWLAAWRASKSNASRDAPPSEVAPQAP